MRRDLWVIAGASAVALVVVAIAQTGLIGGPGGDADAPPEAAPVAAEPTPPPESAEATPPAPGPGVEIARLAAQLEQREAELAELQATLAERSTALDRATATLAERDAALGELTATLAERDAELAALRDELKALRERFAFDIQLAAMKSGTTPDAPRIEEARAEATDLQAMVELATAAGTPLGEEPLTEIHFDLGSARLSPGALAHAAAAAVMLGDMALGRIRIVGFADRTGSADFNRRLAERRARSVADFLASAGVPAELIETAGTIEAKALPVATEAGVPEPLNRCVAIIAVPPPTG